MSGGLPRIFVQAILCPQVHKLRQARAQACPDGPLHMLMLSAGTNLQLQGLESLDAAVYCAAATAAERAAQLEVLLSAVAATQDVQTRSSAVDAVDATSSSLGTEASSSNAGTVQSQVEHSNDNAAEYQQPTPPGLDMLQYWRAMRAMGVPLASSTSSNIEDGPHEQRLYRRPTMHGSTAPFAMGVSAAQRLSEMAAAWAYLSSDGSDMADATARVQVQRPIATRQPAEPVLVLGEASPAAGDYPVANTSGAGHDQAVIQRHHSATNQGSPHSSLVTATGPVSDDVAPPATGSCISNWVATLVRSALECLAARTAESRRAMTATAD